MNATSPKFYLLWALIRVWALIPTNYFRLGSYSSRGSNSSRGPKYSKYGISNLYRNLCTQLSNNSDTIRMNVWTVDLEYEKMRCFLNEYISWKSFISEFVLLFLPCRIPFIASQWRVRLRSIQFVLYSHHMYLLMECILNKLMYQKYNLRRSFIWEFLLLFLPSVSPIIGEFVHEKKAPHLYNCWVTADNFCEHRSNRFRVQLSSS